MVRIPLIWRIVIALIIAAMLLCGGTIYVVRSTSTGYTCFGNNGAVIDSQSGQIFSKWIYSYSYGQRYRQSLIIASPQPVFLGSSATSWIQNGKRTAHLDYYYAQNGSGLAEAWLSIDSPDENIHLKIPTGLTSFPSQTPYPSTQFVWSGRGYSASTQELAWSPDGRFVLLQSYGSIVNTPESWHFSIFGIDGSSTLNVTTIKQDQTTLSLSRVVWSADSRFLIFPQSAVTPDSWAFDTATSRNYRIGNDGNNLPANLRSVQIALPRQDNGKTTIDLMDLDETHRRPLIENADDAGDPSWSSDGKHVAVVWASGQGNQRVVRLSWIDGSNIRTIEDGFWDLHDLHWLADGRALAYVAQRGNGTSLEILDVGTSISRPLSNSYQDIAHLEENPTAGTLTYWWRTASGQTGIDTYRLNGILAHHTPLMLPIEGLELFRDAYRWIVSPEIFRSPDGSVYAVRESPILPYSNKPTGLEIIAADGSWSKLIREDYQGSKFFYPISEPLWSPDSKTVVFGNYVSYNPVLTVLRADGTHVSDIPLMFATRGLSWTQCN